MKRMTMLSNHSWQHDFLSFEAQEKKDQKENSEMLQLRKCCSQLLGFERAKKWTRADALLKEMLIVSKKEI